jgi:hypothetical protein
MTILDNTPMTHAPLSPVEWAWQSLQETLACPTSTFRALAHEHLVCAGHFREAGDDTRAFHEMVLTAGILAAELTSFQRSTARDGRSVWTTEDDAGDGDHV